MRKHLEIKGLVSLVSNPQHSLQSILAESDTIQQTEIVGPSLLHLIAEVGGGKAKV